MFGADLGTVEPICESRSAREGFYSRLIYDRGRGCGRVSDTRPGGGETKAIDNHGEAKSGGLTQLPVQEQDKARTKKQDREQVTAFERGETQASELQC
jgi:hypothetical protein